MDGAPFVKFFILFFFDVVSLIFGEFLYMQPPDFVLMWLISVSWTQLQNVDFLIYSIGTNVDIVSFILKSLGILSFYM